MNPFPREKIDVIIVEHDAEEQARLHALLSAKWIGRQISPHSDGTSARSYLFHSQKTAGSVRLCYDMHANCVMQRTRENGGDGAFLTALEFWLGLVELPTGKP